MIIIDWRKEIVDCVLGKDIEMEADEIIAQPKGGVWMSWEVAKISYSSLQNFRITQIFHQIKFFETENENNDQPIKWMNGFR